MKISVTILFLILALSVSAQTSVSGTIKADDGEKLSGVLIKIKGTDLGTFTDENGDYHLDVPENATLLFSFIGFESLEKPVKNLSGGDFSMKEISQFSELVTVAYRSTSWSPSN